MEEFAKQFIGETCFVYIMESGSSPVQGTVREVSGGGILLEEKNGGRQLINLEYVTRIRQMPGKAKNKGSDKM